MKFGCTSCGCCCSRMSGNIEALKKLGFPHGVKNDGKTCEMFNEKTRLCTVYNSRPDICNVDKTFYSIHSKTGKTKKEVFLNESKICNSFIREAGLDEKYLVDEKQYK